MSFTYVPLRFMEITGVLFDLCAIIGMILVIYEKITVGTPMLGYASLMCVLLFSSGLILLMIGIIGEYVWRALEESRKRPPFIIDVVKK